MITNDKLTWRDWLRAAAEGIGGFLFIALIVGGLYGLERLIRMYGGGV